MISITPFNFLKMLYLNFKLKTKIQGYVYLRSDGFKEYQNKLGIIGYYIYYLMFKIINLTKLFIKFIKWTIAR